MPYNPSTGVYTPPAANFPAVGGTIIFAADYNAVINDVATALSLSFLRDGSLAMTGPLNLGGQRIINIGNGSLGQPSLVWNASEGIYSIGPGDLSVTLGGLRVGWFTSAGYSGRISSPTYVGAQNFSSSQVDVATQQASDNSTKAASTAMVQAALAASALNPATSVGQRAVRQAKFSFFNLP